MLHEIRGRRDEGTPAAAVAGELGAANGVDGHARRVGRVLDGDTELRAMIDYVNAVAEFELVQYVG